MIADVQTKEYALRLEQGKADLTRKQLSSNLKTESERKYTPTLSKGCLFVGAIIMDMTAHKSTHN